MSELVSIRELAKRLAVSDTTVRKAIKKGRIFGSAIVGSKIDAKLAIAQFNKNRDTAKVRKPKNKKEEFKVISSNKNWTTYDTKNKTPEEIKEVIDEKVKLDKPKVKKKILKTAPLVPDEEVFGDTYEDIDKSSKKKKSLYVPDDNDPENELTKQRTRKEKSMADMAELKVLEYEGSLVDVEKATLAIFEVMRDQRDHWLRFPDRIAANMAARFSIDKVEYKTALIEEVKKHCKDVGELKFDLTE